EGGTVWEFDHVVAPARRFYQAGRPQAIGESGERPCARFAGLGRCGYQRSRMSRPIRILGIDPGLRRTGWGVIEVEGNRLIFTACGSVATSDKASIAERLVAIHDGLAKVVTDYAPDEAAVEATFVNKDANATLKLGQARGVALLIPARSGISVAEYAPNLVKKTIVRA